MKKYLLLVASIFAYPTFAQIDEILFYLDCPYNATDCIEIPYADKPESKIKVSNKVEMGITDVNISDAKLSKNEYGLDELNLTLAPPFRKRFAEITENNIGRILVVVAGGKAIIAPQIKSKIDSDSLVITGGATGVDLAHMPWVKQKVDETQAREKLQSQMYLLIYTSIGLLVLGGSVYFAFFSKKRRKKKSNA